MAGCGGSFGYSRGLINTIPVILLSPWRGANFLDRGATIARGDCLAGNGAIVSRLFDLLGFYFFFFFFAFDRFRGFLMRDAARLRAPLEYILGTDVTKKKVYTRLG